MLRSRAVRSPRPPARRFGMTLFADAADLTLGEQDCPFRPEPLEPAVPLVAQCPTPACAKPVSVADADLGRVVRCRACGQSFTARPVPAGPGSATRSQPSAP